MIKRFISNAVQRTVLKTIFILTFGVSFLYAGQDRLDVLKDPRRITQSVFTDAVEDSVINGDLDGLSKTVKLYPENFRNIDMTRAYYETGLKFYKMKTKMLALKVFLNGYEGYSDSPYKILCGYYIAKVLYQQNKRDSALFYINRVLEKLKPGDALTDDAKRLKRGIRWEYISRYEGLPDDSISDIEFDGDDLWLGMWTGGTARYTRSQNSLHIFRQKNGGLVSRHVRDIKIFHNRVYVATYGGLCYYDKKRSKWNREAGSLGRVTVKKLKIIDGRLYAATLDYGLFRLNESTGSWDKFFNGARYVTDINGTGKKLYIATLDKGLFVYENGRFRNIFGDVFIKSLGSLEGNLWVGTHGKGIMVLDDMNRIVTQYTERNGLSSDYVETMETISNQMVIGTLGGGVNIYHPGSGVFRRLTIMGGLPSNDVVRIGFEKNKVWFGTLSGGVGILLTENFEDM